MSIATMADRTLPLAVRVEAAMSVQGNAAHDLTGLLISHALWAALLADVAAADRLARACIPPLRHDDPSDDQKEYDANFYEYEDALDAYRARMAQGVGDG